MSEIQNNPNFELADTVTLSQAAEKLGVTTKTIRNWEEKGKIQTVRTLGGHRRVPLEEIERIQGRIEVDYEQLQKEDKVMAPPSAETDPVLTPSEYEQFLKTFGLDDVDCLQADKSDIELLPEVGLGASINRDHVTVLVRQVSHKIENLLNCRLTDAEFLRINNIVSAAHLRGLEVTTTTKKTVRPNQANRDTPGTPVKPENAPGYLQ